MKSKSDDDWYASGPGRGMCKKCGEERLVQQVGDRRGVQNFCMVCGHSWWINGPLSVEDYKRQFVR